MKLPFRKTKEITRGGYTTPLSWDAYQGYFTYNNNLYPIGLNQTVPGSPQEQISSDFAGLVRGAYASNGVVFACMAARMLLFSEARFQFRQMRQGRPGPLFGTAELGILERPWPAGTTGSLLTRAIQDIDLAGNWFGVRSAETRDTARDRILRLRPDWVTIVMGSQADLSDSAYDKGDVAWEYDAEVIGYLYHPGGYYSGRDPVPFMPDEVAHFYTYPDPTARFRGMSWLNPVIREIMGDNAARDHKLKFFENGATANMIVKLPDNLRGELFDEWVGKFEGKHDGVSNAYRTIYLGGGADASVVGLDFQQMDFKVVQGAGETRIAAAARVPPIIVGLSEGLAAATYSNYGQAQRAFADLTMRPIWREFAAAVSQIITLPPGAELWYDDRDISFLQEDQKDIAEVQGKQAAAAKLYIDAGYVPDSVTDALNSNDLTRLTHSGVPTVQLQQAVALMSGSASTTSNGTAALPQKSSAS